MAARGALENDPGRRWRALFGMDAVSRIGPFLPTLVWGALGSLVAGCAAPGAGLERQAEAAGFAKLVLAGAGFQHVAFYREAKGSEEVLHLYVDGDGSPYLGGLPSPDPTPRRSLVLELAALDPNPVLYLGRPCYLGTASDPACDRRLWTEARYAPAVVNSMITALAGFNLTGRRRPVALIGHSGGGAIAQLMASRADGVVALVTVAANLDTGRWRKEKGLPPLSLSLNPADARIPAGLYQRHYAGSQDDTVPPSVTRAGVQDLKDFVLVEKFGHRCCWRALWPQILADLTAATKPGSPRTQSSRRSPTATPCVVSSEFPSCAE